MADIFDGLAKSRFADIPFPVLDYTIKGGQRNKIHTYPHVHGGKPEKLGRAVYTITVTCFFDTSMLKAYPGLYPDGLNALLRKWEAGETAQLFVPTRGTIKAFCDSWTIATDARVRSGEKVDLTFIEDDEESFLEESILVASGVSFEQKALTLAEQRALYEAEMTPDELSLFDQIDAAVNEVRGALDEVDQRAAFIAAKVERVTNLCSEVEGRVAVAQSARGWPVLEATKELWSTMARVGAAATGNRNPVQSYTVPARMALSQLSSAVFNGDASRGRDLLELNFFADPFAINAGTSVLYYADV